MHGRTFVIPEDIIELAPAILTHHLILSAESKMAGAGSHETIASIVENCEVPVGIN